MSWLLCQIFLLLGQNFVVLNGQLLNEKYLAIRSLWFNVKRNETTVVKHGAIEKIFLAKVEETVSKFVFVS